MPAVRRVFVFANSRFPVGSANSVNVFQTARAVADTGLPVHVVAFRTVGMRGNLSWDAACARFDEPAVGMSATLLSWPISRLAEPLLGIFAAAFLLLRSRKALIMTRSVYVAVVASMLGFRTFFEAHRPPLRKLDVALEGFLATRRNVCVGYISEALGRIYGRRGIGYLRSVLVRDAAKPWRSPPRRSEFQGGVRALGYVGSFYPGRGIEIIFAMAKRLPDKEFHLIGDHTPLKSRDNRCLPQNIVLRGPLPPCEAQRFGGNVDVLLMPYQRQTLIANGLDTTQWMSPMKMFEYMATGRPIISSDLAALREVLHHGRSALLVEPDRVDAWVEAVERLETPSLRYGIAAKAYEQQSQLHTWAARAERITAIYSSTHEADDARARNLVQ